MKTRYFTTVMTSALLTVGLVPLGSAQSAPVNAPEGIEVITVVGKRSVPEGIEVITVVGNRAIPEGIEIITVVATRPEPTVASTCVNEVMAGRVTGSRGETSFGDAQSLESRQANRDSARQAIKDCIEQAQLVAARS